MRCLVRPDRVGSFDGGFGAGFLARVVGQRKRARSGFSAAATEPSRRSMLGLVNGGSFKELEAEGALGEGGAPAQSNGDSLSQGQFQCRNRWLGWSAGAGRPGHPSLLQNR